MQNNNRTLLLPFIPTSLQVYFHLTLYRVFLLLLHWTLLHEYIESIHLLGHSVTDAVLRTPIKESLYYVLVITSLKSSAGLELLWAQWKNKFGALHAPWTDCAYRACVQNILDTKSEINYPFGGPLRSGASCGCICCLIALNWTISRENSVITLQKVLRKWISSFMENYSFLYVKWIYIHVTLLCGTETYVSHFII